MKTHTIILLGLALLTGSCGLIEDADTLPQPQSQENREQLISNPDDDPAKGGS